MGICLYTCMVIFILFSPVRSDLSSEVCVLSHRMRRVDIEKNQTREDRGMGGGRANTREGKSPAPHWADFCGGSALGDAGDHRTLGATERSQAKPCS